eukprot:CAMPEP_0174855314 /NCGR_PEP_ID=MMETSP1114-20130205/32973_1 /TAXON_ID=312471 /ORGANISM="Neobodo designis, Strain CCAP 1951/1" /LENGTH=152 /DNA_ID=CAMNT_0016090049 /DNA_START=32 /DNA_END=490 /DNA_ORIENTATION=+
MATYFAIVGRNDELVFEFSNFGGGDTDRIAQLQGITHGALDLVDAALWTTPSAFLGNAAKPLDVNTVSGDTRPLSTVAYAPLGELRYVVTYTRPTAAHEHVCRAAHAMLRRHAANPFADLSRPLWDRRGGGEEPRVHKDLWDMCVHEFGAAN